MTLQQIYDASLLKFNDFSLTPVLPALRALNEGALNDVKNTNGCANYQWWPGFIDTVKPAQVLELGGAMGVGSLMMLQATHPFDLYSITLAEHGLEFSYVVDTYKNFHPIIGSDLELDNWKNVDLAKTDICYFDSLHTPEHLQQEIDLYIPKFRKGTILVFDDIRSFGLWPIWEKLPYEKLEITNPMHYTGYGLARI